MFLKKFFHFLKGYVILSLTGFNIERFLYMCAARKIPIWDIKKGDKFFISVAIGDFGKMRGIALKTRTRVHIEKKAGLPILFKKYKKRYAMIFGTVVFLLLMGVLSQMIWTVRIEGVKNADEAQIRRVLYECGIREGAFKCAAKSSKTIKNILLAKVDNISWAWVYLKGTKAICKVYEDTIPGEYMEDGTPCNIIAARDGIIKRITAKDGICLVSAGDTVLAGDIIISGVIPDDTGNPAATVAASGIVEAYTWHEDKGTYKLYHEIREYTGNSESFKSVRLFSKEINLFKNDKIGFKDYDITDNVLELKVFGEDLGISFSNKIAHEVNVIKEPISYDTAVYEGKSDLEEKIAKEILPKSELLEENLYHAKIDDETAEVGLTMSFVEQIGIKAPIE